MAGVFEAGGVVSHQPRGFDVGGQAGKLKLDSLKLGDGLAELLAFLGVSDGVFERAARHAEHLRADADAALVERFDRHFVTLADFAQHVRLGNAAIFQDQFARGGGADPQLVLLLAHAEARGVALDQERGDPLVAELGIDGRKEDEQTRLPWRW